MREFINENQKLNQWTWGTVEKLNAIENHFKDFNAKLTLDEYDRNHLSKFVQFLIDKKDKRNSTVKKQFGYLKWFFRWCHEKGYCNCGDYQSFDLKLKTTSKKVIFLDEHELRQLETYEIQENTTTKGGLKVECILDENKYERGKKVTDEEYKTIDIERVGPYGDFSYIIRGFKK